MPVNSSAATILPVTIAAGTSLSTVAVTGAQTLHGILIPSTWTAAGLSFQVSLDGGVTFNEMNTITGTLLNYSAVAGQYITLDPTLWRAINVFKIRSGTLASPVNQAALAILSLALTTLF